MNNQEDKSKLWKAYGILMGTMLGGSMLFLGGQAAWTAWEKNNIRSSIATASSPLPLPSIATSPSAPLLPLPKTSVSKSKPKVQAALPNRSFNAEIFDPPSNCRVGSRASSSVQQVLQKGDVLVDRGNPQTDSAGELWYREEYLGCWLHNSQIRFKATSNFNAEIFDPPSNCRVSPRVNSSVQQVLQKGDVLVDRGNPQTDSRGGLWYREEYLGCWLHNSQIRFK